MESHKINEYPVNATIALIQPPYSLTKFCNYVFAIYIDAGGTKCTVCSTLNVFKLYNGAPLVVRHIAPLSCLPEIMGAGFIKGSQQCSAEFFESFWRILEEKACDLQSTHHILQYCHLKFFDSFCFFMQRV